LSNPLPGFQVVLGTLAKRCPQLGFAKQALAQLEVAQQTLRQVIPHSDEKTTELIVSAGRYTMIRYSPFTQGCHATPV
jgi:hypothetical protein